MVASALPDAIVKRCRAFGPQLLTAIEELVLINSFSHHPEGGTEVAAVLARALGNIDGVHVALHDSDRFAPHLVACTQSAVHSSDGCVALVGHHDTVFPPGTFEGFKLDGKLARGPGVLDMKSGLAIAIAAFGILAEHDELAGVPARLVIVSDEEVGSPDGGPVLERELAGASAALVFEAGRAHDAIITARKGTGSVRVTAAGEGAIVALCTFVDEAQRLTDYDHGVTINVGTVESTAGTSVEPPSASALFDLRFIQTAHGHELAQSLRDIASRHQANTPAHLTVEGGVSRPPLERSDGSGGNVALFREYAAHASAAGLGAGEASLIGGGSDASTTAALGIPSIDGLGPRGTGFHTRDELIEVATLPQRLEALVRFLYARRA